MIVARLGRFFRFFTRQTAVIDTIAECGFEDADYMTDQEIADALHGRGHTVNWNEVRRRRSAGEMQAPPWHGDYVKGQSIDWDVAGARSVPMNGRIS